MTSDDQHTGSWARTADDSSVPFISVVIPVRNRRELLRRALASLAAQTYTSFETIVVDDGSDEPVSDVLDAAGLTPSRLVVGTGAGAGAARNAGVAAAQGQWISFLDSDDEADPIWLDEIARLISGPNVAAVFCGAWRALNGEVVDIESADNSINPRGQPLLFLAGTFMVRADVFRSIGGYDTDLPAAQHTDLGFRIIDYVEHRDLDLETTDQPLVTLHLHDGGNIRSNPEAVALGAEAIIAKHGARLESSPNVLADYCAVAGVNVIRAGRSPKLARSYFARAVRARPGRPIHWFRLAVSSFPALARRRWKPLG